MKAFQILLITLTALTGCNKKAETIPVTAVDTAKTKTMATDSLTYLALGDSYTIGQSEPQSVSYPYQLTDSLNTNGFKVQIPTVIATTGWTTDDLINAISASGITGKKYSFVTLLIGVNDQYQGLSIDNYKVKFAQVLNEAIAFAGGYPTKVFVISIPDYGVTPFAEGQDSTIYPQIMAFNAANQSISQAAGVNYINITPVSRTVTTDPTLLAPDGLHYSGKMYALWVKLLEPVVATSLKN
jgi:lysophospholipase L1-like esterase